MNNLITFVIVLLLHNATLVPEFVASEGAGEYLSGKANLTGSVNHNGEAALVWQDYRDGGKESNLINEDWPQAYVQTLSALGVPQGVNTRIEMGGDFFWPTDTPALLIFDDGMMLTATGRINREGTHHAKEKAIFKLWGAGGLGGSPAAEYETGFVTPLMLATNGEDLCVAAGKTDTGSTVLEFQLFTRTGTMLGEPVEIDSGMAQSVVMDTRGNFVVGYRYGPPWDGGNCFYRRYDKYGQPAGDAVQVAESGRNLCLAGAADGELLCCWMEGTHVYCRLYSSSDQPEGETYDLGQGSFTQGRTLAAACGAGGDYLVVWTRGETFYESDTLYGQCLDPSGVPQGSPFRINEPGAADVFAVWTGSETERYQVAWIERVEEHSESMRIESRAILSTGIVLDPQYRVCDDEPGIHTGWNESLITENDEFFVFWHGPFSLRHFSTSGYPDGSIWSKEGGSNPYPALGLNGSLYLSYSTGEDIGCKIWLQRFDNRGAPQGSPIEAGETENACRATAVAAGVDGEVVVVWEEKIPDEISDVYLWGQRFSSSVKKLGDKILIDGPYYHRGGVRVFKFEDGGFIAGATSQSSRIDYICYFYDKDGKPEHPPLLVEKPYSTTQTGNSMACNGKDRFVVMWPTYFVDSIGFRVYNRHGDSVGTPRALHLPNMVPFLVWGSGYPPTVAMAPDGRFVIAWQEADEAGNLNLWAQLFSADGVPISASFQVNDEDQWDYSFQISDWRGVSCTNDRILFTWLENRRHRGWDVVARVIDWDVPAVSEQPPVPQPSNWQVTTTVGAQIVLRYSHHPGGFHANVYDASGQKVGEIHNPESSGTILWGQGQQAGVYFIKQVSGTGGTQKVVLVR